MNEDATIEMQHQKRISAPKCEKACLGERSTMETINVNTFFEVRFNWTGLLATKIAPNTTAEKMQMVWLSVCRSAQRRARISLRATKKVQFLH